MSTNRSLLSTASTRRRSNRDSVFAGSGRGCVDTAGEFDYYGTYFGLKEGLEQILGRPVDVVSATSIDNPYFRDQVMRTRETFSYSLVRPSRIGLRRTW